METPPQLADAFHVPEIIPRKCKHRKTLRRRTGVKLTLFRARDQLRMTARAQTLREQEQLPLAAAKRQPGINMANPEGRGWVHGFPLVLC
jgi:hypothetical protein